MGAFSFNEDGTISWIDNKPKPIESVPISGGYDIDAERQKRIDALPPIKPAPTRNAKPYKKNKVRLSKEEKKAIRKEQQKKKAESMKMKEQIQKQMQEIKADHERKLNQLHSFYDVMKTGESQIVGNFKISKLK